MKAALASQENNMEAIRNLEMQIGKIAKQLAERHSGQFLANTQTNPKEQHNIITIESGKIVGGGDGVVCFLDGEGEE
ncbi:hypothetical protein PHAVU_011G141100 [Phaseolus vulgaris]|uniref:Uncharacterized protein n=1 Tax=Phaseolus vulgaris TaxID=3885 RepID=V7AJC0_PHAVU|nr:hypothetical protein PHAVU_011G141100g [Phaseolus vulgaris]ESW04973.1 hypothetical protein PHAVU_011G141100g [Phaseolus vulgaris]